MFFSFDGLDGVGKSTQIDLFCAWLRDQRRTVVQCRDPGSTELGEAIREMLLGHRGDEMSMRTEMLLYMAARAQLVEQVVQPAIVAGHDVVSDRYLLANVVYQGHAGGLDPASIWQVGRIATAGVEPDLTFLLDMPPQQAAGRLQRELDRIENRGDEFRARLRAGYLLEAQNHPDRIVLIDAARPIEVVQTAIREATQRILP